MQKIDEKLTERNDEEEIFEFKIDFEAKELYFCLMENNKMYDKICIKRDRVAQGGRGCEWKYEEKEIMRAIDGWEAK